MCAVQYPAAVLVADVDRAGNVGRVMEHRMMTLAQLIVILQFSDAATEGRRNKGRKINVCGALPGEVQSSEILPFQSASLRFPAVWPNASLRTGSKTVRRRSRYRNTWRRRPGPDLENELSVRSPSRIVQFVAYRVVRSRHSPTDVSRPSSAAKVYLKERHELLLATWASRRSQSGAARLRVITLSKEALLSRLKMAD